MKFTFSSGYFSIPSELIEKWAWTGLAPSDLLIICAMLKHAHGDKTTANPSFRTLADEIGMTLRGFQKRIGHLKRRGILEIVERPGTTSIVDLNGLKAFIRGLKPPVEIVGKKCANPRTGVHPPPEPQFIPHTAENGTIPTGNRADTGAPAAPNKGSEEKETCRTKGAAVENPQPQGREGQQEGAPCGGAPSASIDTGQPDPSALPGMLSDSHAVQGAGRGGAQSRCQLTDSELIFLAKQTHGFRGEVDGYPMAEYRTLALSAAIKHSGTVRQGIEEALRLELRHSRIFGIRARLLHEIFSTYPVDGIVWWMNQAHRHARDRSSYFIAMLKKSRGEYPGRKKEAAG